MKTSIIVFIYLLCIVVYIGQGVLYEGNLFTKLSGLYIITTNFCCVFLCKKDILHHRLLFYALLFTIFVFFSWCVCEKSFYSGGEKIGTLPMLQNTLLVFTSIITFYYFSSRNILEEGYVMLFVIVLMCLFIYNILHFDVTGGGVAGEYDFKNTNNKAYSLCALFPFTLIFWRRKWLMLLLMLLSVAFITICAKRGAFICVFLSFLFVLWKLWNGKDIKNIKWIKFFIIIICLLVVYLASELYEYSDLIQKRIEYSADNGMGQRDSIYLNLYNAWLNSPFYSMLLGNGPFSTIKFANIFAHNDWLEILIDFGLITLVVYFIFILHLLRFFMRVDAIYIKLGIMMVIIYIIIRSSFSMCFYELESLLAYGYLGYLIGQVYPKQQYVVL